MNQDGKDYVAQKAKELLSARSSCPEAKAAAQNWLDAMGTDREAEQTRNLIAELEMDIMSIDGLIAFTESATGVRIFGEERIKKMEAHARELKEAGAKYCDCPACTAVAAILEKKDELL